MSQGSQHNRSQRSKAVQSGQLGKNALLVGFLVLSLLVQGLGLTAFVAAPTANAAGTTSATTSPQASDSANGQGQGQELTASLPITNPLSVWLNNHNGKKTTTATKKPKSQPSRVVQPSPTHPSGQPNQGVSSEITNNPKAPKAPPTDTNRQAYFLKSGTSSTKGTKPSFVTSPTRPANIYYVTIFTDDAGTARDCAQSTNTDCSFRSALDAATTDVHSTANPDYIFLKPGLQGGSPFGSGYTPSSVLPTVPDNVAIFGDSNPCTSGLADNTNYFSFLYQAPSPALTLGTNDYVEGLFMARSSGTSVVMQGSSSTYTCGEVNYSKSNGIQITGSNNLVGNTQQSGGNFVAAINGFSNGIDISGATATGNILNQVYVGYIPQNDFFVTGSIPNAGNGVVIEQGASGNYVGLPGSGLTNLIDGSTNGSTLAGVLIDNSNGNYVLNNYIGTDETGTKSVDANSKSLSNDIGVVIQNGATGNVIGGDRSKGDSNVVGNSLADNIVVTSDSNTVQGNYIGIKKDQSGGFTNGNNGIDLYSNTNQIGGEEDGLSQLGNVISGGKGNGIDIGLTVGGFSASNNHIEGNYIGTDSTATSGTVGNTFDGIYLFSGTGNQIGSSDGFTKTNVIGGNGANGIEMFDTGNTVQNNLIGTNINSSTSLGNFNNGIYIKAGNNTIIGNVASNNGTSGISIDSVSTVTVQSNLVGVKADNSGPLPNGSTYVKGGDCPGGGLEDCAGIFVWDSASQNTVISNTVDSQTAYPTGAIVVDAANQNIVQSNTISSALFGIWVLDGASNNQIGGTSGTGNLVQSALVGIIMGDGNFDYTSGQPLSGNRVQGNAIGVNFDGSSAGRILGDGIDLFGRRAAVSGNTIGGNTPALGNLIGNTSNGIYLQGQGGYLTGNTISNNTVGTGSSTGNGSSGIALSGALQTTVLTNTVQYSNLGVDIVNGAMTNTVSSNQIFNNTDGVDVGVAITDTTTNNNTITQNSIYQNSGLGINLHYPTAPGVNGGSDTGPNNQAAEPVIAAASIDHTNNANTLTLTGTANPNSKVELFLQDTNSAVAQGKTYLTTLTADVSGNFSYSGTILSGVTIGTQLVATSTLNDAAFPQRVGSTSQFSAIATVAGVPILTVSPNSFNFSGLPKSNPSPNTGTINLAAQYADAPYSYTVSYAGATGWLAVNPPTSGTVTNGSNVSVPFTITSTTLDTGVYTATVTFANTANVNDTANKTVTIVLTLAPAQVLTVSPTSLNFTATQGGSASPVTQTVTVSSNFQTINYTTNVSYSGNATNWLGGIPANSATTANSPQNLSVSANANGFAAGTYTATVTFTDNSNPSDVVKTLTVVLTVASSQQPPILTVNPTSLSYVATTGGTNPASQSISLTASTGTATYTTTVSYAGGSGSWLSLSPTTGSVVAGTPVSVAANVNIGGLVAGTYTATVNFYNNSNAADPLKTVTVTLTVSGTAHIYNLPFLANQDANFSTYLAFQNIGTAVANVSIQYYDVSGNPISTPSGTCATVPQYGECLPSSPFASGAKGSAVLTSDQPLTVLVSEATPYGGSSYPVNEGTSSTLIAPLAINNYYGGFVTQLTVGNFGASAATVTVNFYGSDGTVQTAAAKSLTIAAHTSATIDQSVANSGLPQGFSGWAQITGPQGSQLVAQVAEQNPNNHFVALANAQFTSQATVYAPAIFNNAFGGFVSGANIINPNANAVNVTITYYDNTGTAYTTPAFTLPAHGATGVYQGDTNSSHPGVRAGGLPSGFYGGAIVSASGGGIVMVVNEAAGLTSGGSARSGTYGAVLNGANVVGLPAVANNGNGFTSGVTVFNTSSQPVSGQIQYYDLTGAPVGSPEAFTVNGQNSTLSPHAVFIAYQGATSLPNGYYGTAVVTKTSGPDNALILTTNMQSANFFYTYSEPGN